jgi:DNA-binding GntR family transcriptional regulator
MAVSRTPIREALNRLASEGFLERFPHRGFRVPQRTMEELIHVYVVLQGLELLAAELALPRLTGADLDQLAEVNAAFAQALGANNVGTAVDLNDRFHHLLSATSGNPVLCGLLDDLRAQVHRLEVLDYSWVLLEEATQIPRDTWVKQHDAILAAARRRDFAGARELLRHNRSLVFQAKVEQARELSTAEAANPPPIS